MYILYPLFTKEYGLFVYIGLRLEADKRTLSKEKRVKSNWEEVVYSYTNKVRN